jgi:hypothetical protein
MSLRGAITFFGEEWARFNRMIEALEREAETHHKRHLVSTPLNSVTPTREAPPSLHPFTPTQSGTASRWGF